MRVRAEAAGEPGEVRDGRVPSWVATALRDGGLVAALLLGGMLVGSGRVSELSRPLGLVWIPPFKFLGFKGMASLAVLALLVLLRAAPVLRLLYGLFRRRGALLVLLAGLAACAGWRWWDDYQGSGYSRDGMLCLVGMLASLTLAVAGARLAPQPHGGQAAVRQDYQAARLQRDIVGGQRLSFGSPRQGRGSAC